MVSVSNAAMKQVVISGRSAPLASRTCMLKTANRKSQRIRGIGRFTVRQWVDTVPIHYSVSLPLQLHLIIQSSASVFGVFHIDDSQSPRASNRAL